MKRILPDNGTVTICEGVVRFVPATVRRRGNELRMQQQWSIITMKDGEVVDSRKEWRDVPTVEQDTDA